MYLLFSIYTFFHIFIYVLSLIAFHNDYHQEFKKVMTKCKNKLVIIDKYKHDFRMKKKMNLLLEHLGFKQIFHY